MRAHLFNYVRITPFFAAIALAGAGCCPGPVLCSPQMSWSADLPDTVTLESARGLSVRACRNSVCFARDFSEAEPLDGTLQIELSSQDDEAYVSTSIQTVDDGLRMRLEWLDYGDVEDGDVYTIDVLDESGTWIAGVGATPVTYRVSTVEGCGGSCQSVILEGSRQ